MPSLEYIENRFKNQTSDLLSRLPQTPTVPEILAQGDMKSFDEKYDAAKAWALSISRLRSCNSANDVFATFSKDAAGGKVKEMYTAMTTEGRQRAMETILHYALGKPIERKMSLDMRVSNASDEELNHEIRRLFAKLGLQGGQREATSLIVEPGGPEERKPS